MHSNHHWMSVGITVNKIRYFPLGSDISSELTYLIHTLNECPHKQVVQFILPLPDEK